MLERLSGNVTSTVLESSVCRHRDNRGYFKDDLLLKICGESIEVEMVSNISTT